MINNQFQTVGVIGCGTIGCGWATFFALRGMNVRLFDQVPQVIESAVSKVEGNLEFMRSSGKLDEVGYESALNNLRICATLEEALEGVDFVQESIFEDYDAKKSLYRQLDALLASDIIIASSSSGLLMTEIQKAAERHPEHCVIGHPINPVYIVPLVEIVPGEQTSQETVAAAKAFYESVDKVPVTLKKEVPGFLENRLTAALWREAIDLVINGVATVEDIDKTCWAGFGLRYPAMGPLLIYHLGGGDGGVRHFIDHLGPAFTQWWSDMNTWTEIPEGAADILEQGVIESMHGKTMAEMCRWRDKKLVDIVDLAVTHRED